jgi:hypothetical protein
MRRMVLSESAKKRERQHAFVRHSTVTFKRILRRGALPEYGDPLPKRFVPELPINCTSARGAVPCADWPACASASQAIGRATKLAFIADEEVAGISREPVW